MINPLRYTLSQGSKVPCLRPIIVLIIVLWVLFQQKNSFEIPCDCKMRAKGLIIHEKEDLEVLIQLYPIPFLNSSARKSNACHKVEETQLICWLPQNVSTLQCKMNTV